MFEKTIKGYNTNVLKVYCLVYSLVAIPMVYYGVNYIELIYTHMSVTLPLFAFVMVLSVVLSYITQLATNKRIRPFLNTGNSANFDKGAMKRSAYLYPLRLTGVMVFGWIVLVNAIVFLPMFFIYSPTLSDLVVCNLLILSSGLMSAPMTYFISERTAGTFLNLEEIKVVEVSGRVPRITLSSKIMTVCLIIIVTLILNTLAAVLLSGAYGLSQAATIVNLAIISVQGIISSVVISLLFARSIKTPIANMSECTGLVKAGDLTETIPRLSNDELGDTSDSYNAFLITLSEIVGEIKGTVRVTGENVKDLQSAMRDTDSSVGEINMIALDVQSTIQSQSAIIAEVTSTIRQIAGTIENQDKRINDQSASVVESSSAIEQMIANIKSIASNLKNSSREFDSLQNAISAGNWNVETLKKNVTLLSKQSDSVVGANAIIKNIAAQTNLLAMNAAIEAAHAGAAGRGFAVVADEIRKLAEISNQQSKLISESLKILKLTIEQAVTIASDTGVSFTEIIRSVQTVNNLEQEIKHAIDEQSSGSSQILQALTGINEITADVHSGSAQMLAGSNLIMSEVGTLVDITSRVEGAASNVVEKAKTVSGKASLSMKLLSLNADNMTKIGSLLGFFKIRS